MDEIVLDVARDFTSTPGGRFETEGKWSGQEFRTRVLEPALDRAATTAVVVVDLDGPEGFTTSFLEEVFGGIIRARGKQAAERVVPRATSKPHREKKARQYMERAMAAAP